MAIYGRNGDTPTPVARTAHAGRVFPGRVPRGARRLDLHDAGRSSCPTATSATARSRGPSPTPTPSPTSRSPSPTTASSGVDRRRRVPPLRPRRRATLARGWARPGTAGLEHRVGGLEKDARTGGVSYDPENHQRMTETRAEKVARIADAFPPVEVEGDAAGDVLVVGWGSTYGAIKKAVQDARQSGLRVGHVQLRWLNPLAARAGGGRSARSTACWCRSSTTANWSTSSATAFWWTPSRLAQSPGHPVPGARGRGRDQQALAMSSELLNT